MSGKSPVPASGRFTTYLRLKHQIRWYEALPLLALVVVPLAGDAYFALATQILIYIILAMSLDILIGYAGIITIGHATFFGLGAYAVGLLSVAGYGEPLSGLAIGFVIGGLAGLTLGAIIVQAAPFTMVMLTLAFAFLVHEVANQWTGVTGGADGLYGVSTWPLLGLFEFDFVGRTAFYYAAVVMTVVWLAVRRLLHAPLGQAILAIKDAPERATFVGASIKTRKIFVFALACAIAGLAGALQAQVSNFVGLRMIGFELSAEMLIILALGGTGRLYGAFLGPAAYLIAQDALAIRYPDLWQLWFGALIVAVALLGKGGLVNAFAGLAARIRR